MLQVGTPVYSPLRKIIGVIVRQQYGHNLWFVQYPGREYPVVSTSRYLKEVKIIVDK